MTQTHIEAARYLHMYTVYDHPRDYPDHFVVRLFLVGPNVAIPSQLIAVTKTLDEARAAIPPGLFRLERFSADDPAIRETWL